MDILRKPWARQWSRFTYIFEGSACINAGSTVDVATTGSKFPGISGYNYSFQRADLYFSASDVRVIDLSVSGNSANRHGVIFHGSESAKHITLGAGSQDWVINRYDPIRLKVTAASGYAHWKIYNEAI